MNWERLGKNQKKLLVLMLTGLTLGLNKNPARSFKIIKVAGSYLKNFDEIERQARDRAIKSLYKSKLVETKANKDGTVTLILSNKGHTQALTYNIEEIKLKKKRRWDKKWRLVIFDIAETKKVVREMLRRHLRQLQFYQLQKSVFVSPYKCDDEILYLLEYYQIHKEVRFIIAKYIDNELEIMKYFNISR